MFSQSFEVLDSIRLNFSPEGLFFMNITIAFIMFGVALDMSFSGFKNLMKRPKPLIVGIVSQIVLLPAVTFLLILLLKPSQGVALGMLLVAACPGGNISNFISSLSKANIELSVSLTAVTTLSAIVITPFNFALWGGLYAQTSPLLRPIEIDPFQMLQTVIILLGIPLALGLTFKAKLPKTTIKILKPVKWASIFLFIGFVAGALSANFSSFLNYIHIIFILVLIHNAVSFLTGYGIATLFTLKNKDRRSVSIETGIQNSGLALALIFNPNIFPPQLELGGMAFIAAWWGIWHIVAGLSIAFTWSFMDKKKDAVTY
jgi:bile acid:Na+ symporter, BASS family